MRRKIQASALALLAMTSLLVLTPASSEAQSRRNRDGFRPPGSSIRIYPRPRYQYQFGNQRIYPGRQNSYWWYSEPPTFYWPYGPPPGYQWPYGNNWNRPVDRWPFNYNRHDRRTWGGGWGRNPR